MNSPSRAASDIARALRGRSSAGVAVAAAATRARMRDNRIAQGIRKSCMRRKKRRDQRDGHTTEACARGDTTEACACRRTVTRVPRPEVLPSLSLFACRTKTAVLARRRTAARGTLAHCG